MNVVKVIEDEIEEASKPYRVSLNGTILINRRGSHRRFASSFAAGLAGAKEIDKRRSKQHREQS